MSCNPTVRDAYAKLGVDKISADQTPRITSQLRRLGKMLEGLNLNLPRDPYYYLNASDHPDARKILDVRLSIPKVYRQLLPIEAFCFAASVPTSRVPEMLVIAAMRMGVQASTMIAAMAGPAVVAKTVERALTDDGVDDRAILHKATGFTPTPKGSQISIHTQVNASAGASAQAASANAPPVESAIKRLSERLNLKRAQSQPALPPSSAQTIEAEIVDEQEPVLLVHENLEGEDLDELD